MLAGVGGGGSDGIPLVKEADDVEPDKRGWRESSGGCSLVESVAEVSGHWNGQVPVGWWRVALHYDSLVAAPSHYQQEKPLRK